MDPGASDQTIAQPVTVRWGLGDAVWIYVAGFIVSILLVPVGVALSHNAVTHSTTPGVDATYPGALTTALLLFGLYAVWVAGLVYISRAKGRGTLHDDFGFVYHARDTWGLLAGMLLSAVLGPLLAPLLSPIPQSQRQQIVDELKSAHGAKLWVLIIGAGFVAPVVEELFFRGLLLRACRRRWSPEVAIAVSGLVFALAHTLGDPQLGVVAILPGLFALGVVSGVAATMTGELSLSISLHMGFNLLTVIFSATLLR
jgi:membrane protease YdiL (CAAX protease family)